MNEKQILNNLEFARKFFDMKNENFNQKKWERSLFVVEDAILYLKCKEVKNK